MATGTSGNDTIDVGVGQSGDNVAYGLGGDDILRGHDRSVLLYGGEGDDRLIGGTAGDFLDGGPGNDFIDGGVNINTVSYRYAPSGVTVDLRLGIAQDTIGAGVDTLRNIHNIEGSDFDDHLIGNLSIQNGLAGGGGNDVLEGFREETNYAGQAGDDLIIVGGSYDNISGGAGSDTVDYRKSNAGVTIELEIARLEDYGFAQFSPGYGNLERLSDIENLNGSVFNDKLNGDSGVNVFKGAGGDDVLQGRGGADTLDGGDGIDTANYSDSAIRVKINLNLAGQYGGDAAGDTLISIENIVGSAFGDQLLGNTLTNDIKGGDGADVILGGTGADTLTGGQGADTFGYLYNAHSGVGVGLRDIITDFSHAQGDLIDVSAFAGDFTFVGTSAFSGGGAHQISYAASGGDTLVSFDSNGDGVADFQVQLIGAHALSASDFML